MASATELSPSRRRRVRPGPALLAVVASLSAFVSAQSPGRGPSTRPCSRVPTTTRRTSGCGCPARPTRCERCSCWCRAPTPTVAPKPATRRGGPLPHVIAWRWSHASSPTGRRTAVHRRGTRTPRKAAVRPCSTPWAHWRCRRSAPRLPPRRFCSGGCSAGGQFNYELVAWKPERVLAFVVNKGGIYYTALAPRAARSVPGILFTGEKDLWSRNDTIEGLFAVNRRAGALWALAEEPNAAHVVGRLRETAMVLFEDVLDLRLGGTSGTGAPNNWRRRTASSATSPPGPSRRQRALSPGSDRVAAH